MVNRKLFAIWEKGLQSQPHAIESPYQIASKKAIPNATTTLLYIKLFEDLGIN